jgi:hypothetical protein
MLQLGLSLQQQQAIADSLSLAKSLVSPLLTQLQQLHSDLAAADLANLGHAVRPAAATAAAAAGWTLDAVFGRPGNMNSAAAAAAAANGASLAAVAVPAITHEAAAASCVDASTLAAMRRWSQLPLQQERAAGLLRLLRKDWLVSCAFTCHVLGCLTWQQLATLMVHW